MGSLMKMYTPLNGIERHRKCLAITKSHFPKNHRNVIDSPEKSKSKKRRLANKEARNIC